MTALHAPGALRLDDLVLLQAQGDDAARFLHGQLTQDVEHLDAAQLRLAGYCSPKGHLLATFWLWRPAPDCLRLATSADLQPALARRLSMFVLRARCRLEDLGERWSLWGLAGADAALGDAGRGGPGTRCAYAGGDLLRLPDAQGSSRHLLALPADAAPPALPALPRAAWDWLEVQSGIARIVAATAEQFVPQSVNFEAVGGVDFRKGCYPGQEVVARSQYRGTLKRRALLFDCEAPARPGELVIDAADPGQPAGQVVLAASWQGRHRVFAEVKIAAVEAGAMQSLDRPGGPALRALALPYALPAQAA